MPHSNVIVRSLRIVFTTVVLILLGRGGKEIQGIVDFPGETCDFNCVSKLWIPVRSVKHFGLKRSI